MNNDNNNGLVSTFINSLKNNLRQYTMIIALVGIWIIFYFFTDGIFLTTRNLSNLFVQSSTISILAMGMVLIIVANHIDLSVGSVAGFIAALIAVMQTQMGIGTVPSILIVIVVGALIGAWHGYWVAYRGVPAFVVTFASYLMFRGGVLGVTGGATIAGLHESFKVIGQGYFPTLFFDNIPDTSIIFGLLIILIYIVMTLRQRRSRINYGFDVLSIKFEIAKIIAISLIIALIFGIMIDYRGIPYAVFIVLITGIVLTFVARKTTFGRQIYAIGGNEEAAALSGINIKKKTLLLFTLMGTLSAISGCVYTARLGAATAQAGTMFEFSAIAGAVIGGTSFSGGKGTIYGAVIGALIMASLDNGMSIMNLDVTYQYIVKGLMLLFAVWIDSISSNR